MVPNTRRRAPRRPRIATTSARCSSSPGARDAPMSARWGAQRPNFQHRRVPDPSALARDCRERLSPPRCSSATCAHPAVFRCPAFAILCRARLGRKLGGHRAATLAPRAPLRCQPSSRAASTHILRLASPSLAVRVPLLSVRKHPRHSHLAHPSRPPSGKNPPTLPRVQPSPYFATVLCSHRLPLPSVPARTQNLMKHPCHAPRAFWAPRAPNAPPSLTCLAPIASARRLFILTRLLHPRSYRPPRVAPRSTSITLEPTLLLTHSLPLALSLARSPLARLGVRTHPSPHRLATSRSRAGARTGLQLPGHGDMQGFNSSSPASRSCVGCSAN
mgnify:CR=1 FL=1